MFRSPRVAPQLKHCLRAGIAATPVTFDSGAMVPRMGASSNGTPATEGRGYSGRYINSLISGFRSALAQAVDELADDTGQAQVGELLAEEKSVHHHVFWGQGLEEPGILRRDESF